MVPRRVPTYIHTYIHIHKQTHNNTGVMNVWAWFRGGCPLVGIRAAEPVEEIIVLGNPPRPTVFTALQVGNTCIHHKYHLCMYVCMYVCMHVDLLRLHLRWLRIDVWIIYIMYVCMHACMHERPLCLQLCDTHTHIHAYICTYTHKRQIMDEQHSDIN
jgi:hypothetical protein